MRGAMMYGPGDVRVEDREDPRLEAPTDAIIRVTASCVCGSDLWPYRNLEGGPHPPHPMGHEYVGVIEEVGAQVTTLRPGQFVVGSFWASDNTCEICRAGYHGSCVNRVAIGGLGAQAEYLRVPLADGTLVATPELPPEDLIPDLLAASDVLGTGWYAAAIAAQAGPGATLVIVGDGAVGLLTALSARQLGAERIIVMSRNPARQALAREFGATDILTERGDAAVARIKDMTHGLGAHSAVDAVGTQEAMTEAIRLTRPGGHVGFVGYQPVQLSGADLFWSQVHLHGGPAPVRRFLPELIDLIWNRTIRPGRVFDLHLPLEEANEGYRAMIERTAIKVLLTPGR